MVECLVESCIYTNITEGKSSAFIDRLFHEDFCSTLRIHPVCTLDVSSVLDVF